MKRLLLLPILLALIVAGLSVTGLRAASSSREAASGPPAQSAPTCNGICEKSGVNVAVPIFQPMDAGYSRMQQLGMAWDLEITAHTSDTHNIVEAIDRAHAHDVQFILLPFCTDNACAFTDPADYGDLLAEVAAQVDGDFWAMLGPMEPDSLGMWAGDAVGVANYMNALLDQVGDIPNLRAVSPGFNLSNGITHNYFAAMEAAGARFEELDALAGTSYSVAGNGAYYYYAQNANHAEKFREKTLRYRKPFIFVEYGTFDMLGKSGDGNPARAPVVQQMKAEFRRAANDPTVIGILHFNAFGDNPQFAHHTVYDAEIVAITEGTTCTGEGFRNAGVGITTPDTIWQLSGEPACRVIAHGCPFDGGVTCSGGLCIDTDGDGFLGGGGDAACVRDDCNDTDPASGLSCGGGLPDEAADWGTIRVLDHNLSHIANRVWAAVSIRNDGLPIVAYHGATQGGRGLTVLSCTATDCATALRHVASQEFEVGTYATMQIRQNGLPLIAYLDLIDFDFEVYDCSDTDCSAGTDRLVKTSNAGRSGYADSMAIRNDGRPVIAFWHSWKEDLGIYDCSDPACSANTLQWLDTGGQTGRDPSIVIGADGNPLVAYSGYNDTSLAWELRLARCTDANCAASNWIVLDAANATSFGPRAIAVRSTGLPIILYRQLDTNTLALYDCTAADCSSGTSVALFQRGDVLSASASLIVLGDDTPFIAYSEPASGGDYDLTLVRCLDVSCTDLAATTHSAGGGGVQPDIVLRNDGNPFVVFHDPTEGNLSAYDVDMNMVPTTSTPPAPVTPPDDPTPGTPTPDTPIPYQDR